MGFSLSGAMIPRTVRRMFDERHEPRLAPAADSAVLGWRGTMALVPVCNVSDGGAMIAFESIPHIGERVTIQFIDRDAIPGQVRWVRDGRVGINFTGARD